jgi:hypothetical protein
MTCCRVRFVAGWYRTSTHRFHGSGEPIQVLPVASSPVPTLAPVVDGSSRATTVDGVWAAARSGVEAKPLTRSECLDGAAKAYASAAAKGGGAGGNPEAPKADCGGDVRFGYVLGWAVSK